MRALQYYFYEYQSGKQYLVHHFGTNHVAAFTAHRRLERQGKTLSAVQSQKPAKTHTAAA